MPRFLRAIIDDLAHVVRLWLVRRRSHRLLQHFREGQPEPLTKKALARAGDVPEDRHRRLRRLRRRLEMNERLEQIMEANQHSRSS